MHLIYYLTFVLSVLATQAQVKQTFDIDPLLIAEGDSSILYPKFKGFSGAENINTYLQKHINTIFYLDSNQLDLEAAAFKGLDSLTYHVFETDSTISIKIMMLCHKGKLKSRWNDYFTFAKTTGKKLTLYDVFLKQDYTLRENMILWQFQDSISALKVNLTEAYQQGAISKKKYDVLLFLVDRYTIPDFSDDFLLDNEYILLYNGMILPDELSGYLPNFFKVNPKDVYE